MGRNKVTINRETVELAIKEWLNDGIYNDTQKLIVHEFQRHQNGGMTLTIEPRGPFSETHKKRLEAAGVSTVTSA
jgi:hypothetical protein